MRLEAVREYLKLSGLPPFHPWRARLFFRSSSHCVQPWRLSESPPALLLLSSLFPFTPSDILEPLFDGLCLYLSLAYFSAYLRMFSYVYFYQSVPCCCLQTQTKCIQTHMLLFSITRKSLQKSHVLSVCVTASAESEISAGNCTMNVLALKPTVAPQSRH